MRFHAEKLWSSIHRVPSDPGKHWVAVPYVSQGAAQRLPLRKGDVLITRFDDRTIRSGQTDPREILKYLHREVEVHHCAELHAKVYVSARRSVICSANLSGNSEVSLKEAGVVSTEAAIIREVASGIRTRV